MIFVPDPIYSNDCPEAKTLLCLKNGTVVPTPTAYGTFSFKVIVHIPAEIGVDRVIE